MNHDRFYPPPWVTGKHTAQVRARRANCSTADLLFGVADDQTPSLLSIFVRRFLGRPLRHQRRMRRRNYPDDPIKELYEAAKSGDADLLDDVFQRMNVNERASALETTTDYGVQIASGCTCRYFTPLMIASNYGHVNAVTCLVKHGANIDTQDEYGNTALHFAVYGEALEVANKLLSLGASQLYNRDRLTPLLLASEIRKPSMVESLIERPECTKEQRIDALEFLGASCATLICCDFNDADIVKAFQYVKRGMEERFQDPSHPLLKQPTEPVEAYQNRKESQTPEELAQIEGDVDAILMESLIITERILGTDSSQLLRQILYVAGYHEDYENFDICIGLHRHSMEISQRCYYGGLWSWCFDPLTVFFKMVKNGVPPRQEVLVEFLEKAFLEHERIREVLKMRRELFGHLIRDLFHLIMTTLLLNASLRLLQTIAKGEICEADKNSSLTVFLRKLSCLNPRGEQGDTLLHLAAVEQCLVFGDSAETLGFSCAETVKFLLNAGFDVNTINNNGDTPLHRAVTFDPSSDEMHVLTDILEILLDGGAHQDFVNNDGKTAMDMAATHEAHRILSERKTLELKCIAAKAVKKFGLPYLGVVPRTLEKYISMH